MHKQRLIFATGLLLAIFLGPVWGQQQPPPGLPAPRLLLVFPMGGKAGSTVEVIVTGQDVEDANNLNFNIPGIKAELVGPVTGPDMKKQPLPGVGKTSSVKFKVSIPADALPGLHDMRISSPFGVSN